jgi:multidrug resistance efflux pump
MNAVKRIARVLTRLLIAAVLLLGFAAALWGPSRVIGWLSGAATTETVEAQEVRFYTVQRQNLVIALSERGTLRATRNVKIGVPFGSGRRRGGSQATIAWLRPEGDLVAAGDLIIQFEKQGFEDAILNAEEQLAEQEKRLEIAILNIEIEEASKEAVIAAARTKLRDARENLRRYREEEAPKKLRSLISAKRDAREKLDSARNEYTDIQRNADELLMGDEAAQEKARADVEKARKAVETAEKAYDDASSNQKKFRSYEYPETLEKRAESVKNAELDLERTRVNAVNRVANQETEVRRLEQQIERTNQTIREQSDMLERADVKAPVAGRLLYGDTDRDWPRPEDIKVGGQSWAGMNLMTIPDESVFEIDIYIAEEYRYRIARGAHARVVIEAIPGLDIQGVVNIVENFAKTPPGGGPKKYKASIAIDKTDDRLASGMNAQVEIVAETVPDAMVVPIEAVYNIEGSTVCFVRADDEKLERRNIMTGKSSDHYVQILDGLQLGELVALTRPADVIRQREDEAEDGEVEADTALAGREAGPEMPAPPGVNGPGSGSFERPPRSGSDTQGRGSSGQPGRGRFPIPGSEGPRRERRPGRDRAGN